MANINNLLKASSSGYNINGTVGVEILKDYQHAARIFVDGNYRLSPKYGFLFYVEFDFNPDVTNLSPQYEQELGMIVKSVTLPKYTIETKVHNAYNRKNIVQNAIKYDPVTIAFHDDQDDMVRNFWYDYYSFYYRDSDYDDSTYQVISKYQERPTFDWGYTPRRSYSYQDTKSGYQAYQYIQAIRIYSLHQKAFSEYELVNPIISSFKHGDHSNGGNEVLENTMTIQFESVKYQTGYVTNNTAGGFIDLHYDNVPSPIAPADTSLVVNAKTTTPFSAPSTVTDLATTDIVTTGPSTNIPPVVQNISAQTSNWYAQSTTPLVNMNAYLVPTTNFGMITSGISNSTFVQQQLNYDKTLLTSAPVAGVVGGVISGITGASLQQGVALAGLVAAAAKNPQGAKKAIENMAVSYAMNAVNAATAKLAAQVATSIGTSVAGYTSSVASDANQYFAFGHTDTFTSGISESWNNLLNGNGFTTNYNAVLDQSPVVEEAEKSAEDLQQEVQDSYDAEQAASAVGR